jgi:hypothetical protein
VGGNMRCKSVEPGEVVLAEEKNAIAKSILKF